ncbi:MAG: ROK family protein [Limisphaerales bacterium]
MTSNPESIRPLIGVDIGGTKIAVAAVHPTGRIVAQCDFPTDAERGFDTAVRRISEAIDEVTARAASDSGMGTIAGIGIGCAGPVDPLRGLINNPFTLTGWNRCDIVRPLERRFEVPVRLENDADVAALGECWVGAGMGASPVVMLTFGTGVGGAAVVAGQLVRGVGGEHPELGHVPVDPQGPACYCGISGCLESIASGSALGEAGKALGLNDAREVFAAADGGSKAAQSIVDRAVDAACAAAWTIFHTLLPRRLILGGGMMDTEFERFVAPMRNRISRATQFTASAVEISRARLGNTAGIVGAASLLRPGHETGTGPN